MKISKIEIKNLYGISQISLDDKSIELTGTNGVGKSSVIDAIKLALTNNSDRKYIVQDGNKEGSIYIETDTGLKIDRRKRTDKSDYKSIKDVNGNEISSPETFLKDIFTPLQLEPVEFLEMSEKEQNKLLLDLIEFKEDKKKFIKEKFGEEYSWINYDESILEILNTIQVKDSPLYQLREDINRDIRNNLAIANDISKDIPENYDVDKWREYTLSEKYEELNKDKSYNEKIDRSITYKEDYNNKVKSLDSILENCLLQIDKIKSEEKQEIENKIADFKNQISLLEKDLSALDTKYQLNINNAHSEHDKEIAKLDENIKVANEWASKEKRNTEELENELKIAEEMKGHINEYDRMKEVQAKADELSNQSKALTDKIELARTLPGDILKTAKIPVEGLTVEDGIPLVNNLPISNLSERSEIRVMCVNCIK